MESTRSAVDGGKTMQKRWCMTLGAALILATFLARANPPSAALPWIEVDAARGCFVTHDTKTPFYPWGFNYDHDARDRLIEDYWDAEWAKVEADFRQMRRLGANVARIHLQFGRFCPKPNEVSAPALDRLSDLMRLAEREGIYLDLTGLGCYHKKDVPAWYDRLSESERWAAQAFFWEAIARRSAASPAIFCYDLMNEPVVPGGRRGDGEWLGPPFAEKHFVQFITLDQAGRPRPAIARQWIDTLVQAIRRHDARHLITVGMVDWSLDRPGLTSGFVPGEMAPALDFLAVHVYPESKKLAEATATLKGFHQAGKPLVVEEIFPLHCSGKELEAFIDQHRSMVQGWISFYWGGAMEELRANQTIAGAMIRDWLERFEKRAERMKKPPGR